MNKDELKKEAVENKINHSWDGKLYAINDNSLEYIDVTDEINEIIDKAWEESEKQERKEMGAIGARGMESMKKATIKEIKKRLPEERKYTEDEDAVDNFITEGFNQCRSEIIKILDTI